MDLKKEFTEYKNIYNVFLNDLKQKDTEIGEKKKKIAEKDKEDIAAQHESTEKKEILEDYMVDIFKISLVQTDIYKIAQRLLYINESAVRQSIDLQLSEEDKGFMRGLSEQNKMTYVVDNNGKLTEKTSGLDEIIKARVKERSDMSYAYLEEIRKSPEYGGK